MEIKSLGLKTELFFYQHNANIFKNNNYLKIETPGNPHYFWGNLLIFEKPPRDEDFILWNQLFEREFGSNPEIKHKTFTWDIFGEQASVKKFIEAGFILEETIVLGTSQIKSQFINNQFAFKKIETDHEWKQVIDLQVQIGIETEKYIEEKYRPFVTARFSQYRMLSEKQLGDWYGAFLNDELVADLGLFGTSEFARFQSIETKKNFRRKGIAQSLIDFASTSFKSNQYVIEAISDGPAIDMYMRIGFEIKEVISGLCLYNTKDWKS